MTAAAVRRNGPYAPLGANYADDDAIATLDLEENDRAELLWTRGLAYCARDLRLNGFISDVALRAGKVLRRRPGKKGVDTVLAAAERLVDLNLWVRVDGGYRIRSWSKWNRTWTEVEQKRATDRGRKTTPSEPDDDPTPDGRRPEATRNDDGIRDDSTRNPSGTRRESLSRAPAGGALHVTTDTRHDTTLHDTTQHPPGGALAPLGSPTINAADIVASYINTIHELGIVLDPRAKGRIAKDAAKLLTSGAPPELLTTAAQRLAVNGYADLGAEVRRLQTEHTRNPTTPPRLAHGDAYLQDTMRRALAAEAEAVASQPEIEGRSA